MEKFFALPSEKQNTIVDAAMRLFGAVGYKKASIADIAAASGISKAMVFYYFGSKKALYLYLVVFAGNTIKAEVDHRLDKTVTDFFDKIRLASEIKISVLKKFPGILSFLTAMYYENDQEVESQIKRIITESESFASSFVMESTDRHKFKSDVDPELVFEILTNYAEGYMSKLSMRSADDFDILTERFYRCLDMMKNNFYKDEYLF